jgi:hypothetical protein
VNTDGESHILSSTSGDYKDWRCDERRNGSRGSGFEDTRHRGREDRGRGSVSVYGYYQVGHPYFFLLLGGDANEHSPMLTVFAIGERCAEIVAEVQGWKREVRPKL